MIVLALDSTAKTASCALVDGDRLLAESFCDNGLTQSETLLPMAENLLRSCRLTFSDVSLFACTAGPGSFTGVRIGVAAVKGLAFGRDVPCVGVSTLASLAENLSEFDGIAVACMDARQNQVYAAVFRVHGGTLPERITEDMAIGADELCALLRPYTDEHIYLVGDGYAVMRAACEKNGIPTCVTPTVLRSASGYATAKIALREYAAGRAVSDRDLSPVYLRLPQAERERLEKENQK